MVSIVDALLGKVEYVHAHRIKARDGHLANRAQKVLSAESEEAVVENCGRGGNRVIGKNWRIQKKLAFIWSQRVCQSTRPEKLGIAILIEDQTRATVRGTHLIEQDYFAGPANFTVEKIGEVLRAYVWPDAREDCAAYYWNIAPVVREVVSLCDRLSMLPNLKIAANFAGNILGLTTGGQ